MQAGIGALCLAIWLDNSAGDGFLLRFPCQRPAVTKDIAGAGLALVGNIYVLRLRRPGVSANSPLRGSPVETNPFPMFSGKTTHNCLREGPRG